MRLAAKWTQDVNSRYARASLVEPDPLSVGPFGIEVARFGRGEPIVLVPGLAGGWKLLAPLARRLAAHGHQAILVGLRGDHASFGDSRPMETLADYAEDLDRVLRSLRLERPILLGVSFGGAVALEWAVENPRRLGGLILHGVEPRFRPNLGSHITQHVLQRFPLPANNRFVNQFFNLLHGGRPDPGPLVDFVVERCWETDQAVVAGRLKALASFDVIDRLDRIEAPTLVVAGSKDVVVPARRQEAMARRILGARFVGLDGAGHIGFLTHDTALVHAVDAYLREAQVAVC